MKSKTLIINLSHKNKGFDAYEPGVDLTANFSPVLPSTISNGKIDTIAEKPKVILTGPEAKKRKIRILKNIIIISFGFLFLFSAFSSLANIQSSLNEQEGLGLWTLSVIYGSLVISCLFLPTVIISRLGCKWTIVCAMLMYGVHMAANFKSTFASLIPTAAVLGLSGAPLWSAKCTYLTQVGAEYADLVGEKVETIIVRFFGIFFMFFQSGQIWGNLISATVLNPGDDNLTISQEQLNICGADFCNQELPLNATETGKPDKSKVYMLCGIYVGCAVFAALLVAIFVDPLVREGGSAKEGFSAKLFIATIRHLKNYKQILLIPLTIFSGVEQAFIAGDYTRAFVTCALGIHKVGLVMICFGVVNAIGSIGFGPLVKKFGRVPLYLLGTLTNIAMIILMLQWKPNPDQTVIFFLIPGLWGMADAVWQTQINAFYGVIFSDNEEAAFSNYRLWESLGFIMAFAYSNYICVHIKLYIVLGILIAGIAGYLTIEIILKCHEDKKQPDNENLKY